MNSIAFIVKSSIKNKTLFYQEVEKFRSLQVIENIEIFETNYKKHAIELAEQATENRFNIIIAVGGDGTLNEVVNGILKAESQTDILPVLGILPFGSANDFARGINITNSIEELVERIKHDRYREIDLGSCEFVNHEGSTNQRYFINIVEGGIGAMVVKKVNASNKPLGPKFAFMKAITESFLTYTPTQVYCKTDLEYIEEKILTIAICNGPFLGNGLCIAPDAKVDDGTFAMTCIYDISLKDYILNLRKLYRKEKIVHPKVYYSKAKSVEISPKQFSLAVEGDGEFFGFAPFSVKMLHKKIRFLMD